MAEGVGFEPTVRFPAHTRSRRAPSTTRPPLRELVKQARNIAGCPLDASAELQEHPGIARATATPPRRPPRTCLAAACGRYYKVCGRAVSSVVERLVYTEDVGSSTLSPPTNESRQRTLSPVIQRFAEKPPAVRIARPRFHASPRPTSRYVAYAPVRPATREAMTFAIRLGWPWSCAGRGRRSARR